MDLLICPRGDNSIILIYFSRVGSGKVICSEGRKNTAPYLASLATCEVFFHNNFTLYLFNILECVILVFMQVICCRFETIWDELFLKYKATNKYCQIIIITSFSRKPSQTMLLNTGAVHLTQSQAPYCMQT